MTALSAEWTPRLPRLPRCVPLGFLSAFKRHRLEEIQRFSEAGLTPDGRKDLSRSLRAARPPVFLPPLSCGSPSSHPSISALRGSLCEGESSQPLNGTAALQVLHVISFLFGNEESFSSGSACRSCAPPRGRTKEEGPVGEAEMKRRPRLHLLLHYHAGSPFCL